MCFQLDERTRVLLCVEHSENFIKLGLIVLCNYNGGINIFEAGHPWDSVEDNIQIGLDG